MSDAWLAFLGGVLATLVGGLVASIVQRHNEAVKRKAEARLDVYFRLLDLNQQYFWIASSFIRLTRRSMTHFSNLKSGIPNAKSPPTTSFFSYSVT